MPYSYRLAKRVIVFLVGAAALSTVVGLLPSLASASKTPSCLVEINWTELIEITRVELTRESWHFSAIVSETMDTPQGLRNPKESCVPNAACVSFTLGTNVTPHDLKPKLDTTRKLFLKSVSNGKVLRIFTRSWALSSHETDADIGSNYADIAVDCGRVTVQSVSIQVTVDPGGRESTFGVHDYKFAVITYGGSSVPTNE